MPYTEQNVKRIAELIQEIEARKEHEYAAPTYKDSAALAEIAGIVNAQLDTQQTWDEDALCNSILAVRYLAEEYKKMWRCAVSVRYYNKLIELTAMLADIFSVTQEISSDDYYSALRARNYYSHDDCADLSELAAKFLSDDKRRQIESDVFARYPDIKYDSVELSDKYLSVIDEVERRMYELSADKMHGLEQAGLKAKLLSEYGIHWRSVMELNPNMHF
ncbi:MAG: hypothetical protein ACI396_02390, partial [Acutalibacteraceae bacterium]